MAGNWFPTTHSVWNLTVLKVNSNDDTIRYDTIRYDTIRYDTIRYDTPFLRLEHPM
ncbi:MAG: hypothetical protein LBD20_00345 [Spirochaetaceae bacterium]|nr:hypothetical protein [Spirochaetaceae bacterium]